MQVFIYAVIIVSLLMITLSVAGAQEQPLKGGFNYYGSYHVNPNKPPEAPKAQRKPKPVPGDHANHPSRPRCHDNAAGKWVCQ